MSDFRHFQHDKITQAQGDLQKLATFNESVSDWYAFCPKCKTQIRGSLAKIREHKCDR
jgi:hypothetical protein